MAAKKLPEKLEALAATKQSFCEAAVAVDGDVSGRCQIPAHMIRCKLAVVGQTAGCLALGADSHRRLAVLRLLCYIPVIALYMMTVAGGRDKIQREGKRGAHSDDVHGWAEVEEAEAVAHGLEDNGIVEDIGEVAAEVQGKNYAVEDTQEEADNAHHNLLEVEGRIW